jgi:molybdopterin converting factor small subunit
MTLTVHLRRALAERYPALAPLLERSAIAVNHDFADDSSILRESDEIAVIPPVSGG